MPRQAPVARFVDLILAGDVDGAAAMASALQERGARRVDVICDLIHPAQYRIGDLWYAGTIRVADEHRATAVVERVVEGLRPAAAPNRVPAGSACVIAALPGTRHLLGLRMLQMALEDDGWDVTAAGVMDPSRVVEVAKERRPRWVGLSAGYLRSQRPLREAVAAIRAAGTRVLCGGAAFNRSPGLWERLGADATAADARMTVVLVRRWGAR